MQFSGAVARFSRKRIIRDLELLGDRLKEETDTSSSPWRGPWPRSPPYLGKSHREMPLAQWTVTIQVGQVEQLVEVRIPNGYPFKMPRVDIHVPERYCEYYLKKLLNDDVVSHILSYAVTVRQVPFKRHVYDLTGGKPSAKELEPAFHLFFDEANAIEVNWSPANTIVSHVDQIADLLTRVKVHNHAQ